jgi:hypothetical protein
MLAIEPPAIASFSGICIFAAKAKGYGRAFRRNDVKQRD